MYTSPKNCNVAELKKENFSIFSSILYLSKEANQSEGALTESVATPNVYTGKGSQGPRAAIQRV